MDSAYQRPQQEMGESRSDVGVVFRVVQLLPQPLDTEDDTGRREQADGSQVVTNGIAPEGGSLIECKNRQRELPVQ